MGIPQMGEANISNVEIFLEKILNENDTRLIALANLLAKYYQASMTVQGAPEGPMFIPVTLDYLLKVPKQFVSQQPKIIEIKKIPIAPLQSGAVLKPSNLVQTFPKNYTAASDDLTLAIMNNHYLIPAKKELRDFIETEASNIPEGKVYLLGGGDGYEARFIASSPNLKSTEINNIDHSTVAIERTQQLSYRFEYILNLKPIYNHLSKVEAFNYPKNETSLVIANQIWHLIPKTGQNELAKKLQDTLKVGGKIYLQVRTNQGQFAKEKLKHFKQDTDGYIEGEHVIHLPTTNNNNRPKTVIQTIPFKAKFYQPGEIIAQLNQLGFSPPEYHIEHKTIVSKNGFFDEEVIITKVK